MKYLKKFEENNIDVSKIKEGDKILIKDKYHSYWTEVFLASKEYGIAKSRTEWLSDDDEIIAHVPKEEYEESKDLGLLESHFSIAESDADKYYFFQEYDDIEIIDVKQVIVTSLYITINYKNHGIFTINIIKNPDYIIIYGEDKIMLDRYHKDNEDIINYLKIYNSIFCEEIMDKIIDRNDKEEIINFYKFLPKDAQKYYDYLIDSEDLGLL